MSRWTGGGDTVDEDGEEVVLEADRERLEGRSCDWLCTAKRERMLKRGMAGDGGAVGRWGGGAVERWSGGAVVGKKRAALEGGRDGGKGGKRGRGAFIEV